jgi:hypothetical protein
MYPNPVTNNLQIYYSSQGEYKIVVCDLKGKKTEDYGPFRNRGEISLSHLSKGVYILKFMQKGQMLGKKKVIKY